MMLKTTLLAAVTSALIVANAPASARDSSGDLSDLSDIVRVSDTVNASDLDASQTEGATALLERIESTAKRLCRPALRVSFGGFHNYRTCVDEATDRTVRDLGNPLVSELHLHGNAAMSVAQNR